MQVPFVDLTAQYQAHRAEFDAALEGVIARTAFIGGEAVKKFESDYARQYGVRHVIACGNGTDAIYIVLRMLGIGPGDEVITTASSWISTSETVTQAGAEVRFVDVDEYYGLDVGQAGALTGNIHLVGGILATVRARQQQGELVAVVADNANAAPAFAASRACV